MPLSWRKLLKYKFLRAQLSSHIAKLKDEFPSDYQSSFTRRSVAAVRKN
jgi:hypothetical protein